jgi:hypothetical protein
MEKNMKKMRELAIFQNKISLNDKSTMILHIDDMPPFASWFLTTFHYVDKVIYRGQSNDAPTDIPNLKDSLQKLGNPKNILITYSEQDTY